MKITLSRTQLLMVAVGVLAGIVLLVAAMMWGDWLMNRQPYY